MKRLKSIFIRLYFGIIALPRVLFSLVRSAGRVSYLRARYPTVSFGEGCYVDDECTFEEGVRVCDHTSLHQANIGMFTYFSPHCSVQLCRIGRYCSVGPQVIIGLGMHPSKGMISTYPGFYSLRKHAINYRQDSNIQEYKQILINNDVWIGARAIVMDGVTIGDGAIIAAGSVVTKDVAAYTIVGGVPARLIRRRFSEEDARSLVEFAWWNRGSDFCRKNAALFGDVQAFMSIIASEKDCRKK